MRNLKLLFFNLFLILFTLHATAFGKSNSHYDLTTNSEASCETHMGSGNEDYLSKVNKTSQHLGAPVILIYGQVTPLRCVEDTDGRVDIFTLRGLPPYTYLWSNGSTSKNLIHVPTGVYSVRVTDVIGRYAVKSFFVPVSPDTWGPAINCSHITKELGSDGSATIIPEDIGGVIDDCHGAFLTISRSEFNCELGVFEVTVIAEDASGNSTSCTSLVTITGDDNDCDGIPDACDLCDGGDDTVDRNNDGRPDCAYPPAYSQISSNWKCGYNKVLICVYPFTKFGVPETNCVSKNVLWAYYPYKYYLGPCDNSSCNGSRSKDKNTENYNIELYPNPVMNILNLDISMPDEKLVKIYDQLGKLVYKNKLEPDMLKSSINILDSKFTNGIYFISVSNGTDVKTKKFIIQK